LKYRKLDSSRDYVFGGNQNDFLTGNLAVAQAIKTNLLLLQGEWWEDVDKGLPLFQNILGQTGTPENDSAIDLLVQGVISSTQGVTGIKDFTSSYEKRKYSVSCTAETIYGDTVIQEVIF